MNDPSGIDGVSSVTLRKNVSPLTGLEKTIKQTQGGALRLAPRRSALGWHVSAFQAEEPNI